LSNRISKKTQNGQNLLGRKRSTAHFLPAKDSTSYATEFDYFEKKAYVAAILKIQTSAIPDQGAGPMDAFPDNVLELINTNLGGFNNALGLRFIKAAPDEYIADLEIDDRHLQPYGLVHGGVYAGMIETLCSTGAALTVWEENKHTVGLENNTSFLKAVRSGRLRCTARPLVLGKRSHVWEASVHDDRNRLVAAGRVRLMVLEPGAEAAGAEVTLQGGSAAESV
jgi:uncharacterized protein (TIGR00369 family)